MVVLEGRILRVCVCMSACATVLELSANCVMAALCLVYNLPSLSWAELSPNYLASDDISLLMLLNLDV